MYLGRVNRGVSFTKAGFYATGFVILIGFIATGSGYNALFLALGYGLSIITISGMLSERVMKELQFEGMDEVSTQTAEPFSVMLRIRNNSPTWFVFGVETLLSLRLPRFRLISSDVEAPIEGKLLTLGPLQSLELSAYCKGLPRGIHRRFFVVLRTLYPFGLLTKFKVTSATTRILVLPKLDEALAKLLGLELQQRLLAGMNEQDFHSHRLLAPGDPLRLVDWRKSAGRDVANWEVKVYESPERDFGIFLNVDWASVRNAASEEAYEMELSRIRTACEVIRRLGRRLVMNSPNSAHLISSYEACAETAAGAPAYRERETISESLRGEPAPGWYLRLQLNGSSFEWKAPVLLGAKGAVG